MNVHEGAKLYMVSDQDQKQTVTKMDAALLETIYNQHYDSVYNYICFRINNHYDAEELTSEVFENTIRRFPTYKPELAPIQAWLIGIAKNVVADYFRAKKRRTFVPMDEIMEIVSPERQPQDIVVFNEANKALMRAMFTLKDAERQILSMKFATDLKNQEIAKILGISDTNVSTISNRAVKKLKKVMEKEERS